MRCCGEGLTTFTSKQLLEKIEKRHPDVDDYKNTLLHNSKQNVYLFFLYILTANPELCVHSALFLQVLH